MTFILSDTMVESMVRDAFQQAHNFQPRPSQLYSTSKIIRSFFEPRSIKARPILFVAPTGIGKSAVRDAVGLTTAGVVLTICPLLSLSADQTKKLHSLTERHPNTEVFNLDNLANQAAQSRLSSQLLSLDNDTDSTVFIFSSPQRITNSPLWRATFDALI
jgi:superfamily II DNA helicase RecQ